MKWYHRGLQNLCRRFDSYRPRVVICDDDRMRETFQSDQEQHPLIETTVVDGVTYQREALVQFAEQFPVQEIPTEEFRAEVGPEHVYWVDRNGVVLAPHQLLSDWEAAQQNEAWADHVVTITRANLDEPIWMKEHGRVFDGVHRLTRAVLEQRPTVKVRVFTTMPPSV